MQGRDSSGRASYFSTGRKRAKGDQGVVENPGYTSFLNTENSRLYVIERAVFGDELINNHHLAEKFRVVLGMDLLDRLPHEHSFPLRIRILYGLLQLYEIDCCVLEITRESSSLVDGNHVNHGLSVNGSMRSKDMPGDPNRGVAKLLYGGQGS